MLLMVYGHFYGVVVLEIPLPFFFCLGHQERMALWKDCCSRSKKKMECGSDGNWYPNKCFLYKANGFRKPGAPEIKVIRKDKNSVCKTPPNEGKQTFKMHTISYTRI